MTIDLRLGQLIVDLLAEAHELDPVAVQKLIEARVGCNAALAEHATIQAGPLREGGPDEVGLLGLLNGLAGTHPSGWGCVAAVYDGGRLLGFRLLTDPGPDDG